MKTLSTLLLLAVFSSCYSVNATPLPCKPVTQAYGLVCQCDEDYCDTVTLIEPTANTYAVYQTSQGDINAPLSFHWLNGSLHDLPTSLLPEVNASSSTNHHIYLNVSSQYQQIIGFGGALTDAAAIVYDQMNKSAQDKMLQAYYGPQGIGYSLGRT